MMINSFVHFIKKLNNHRLRFFSSLVLSVLLIFLLWPLPSYRVKGGESLRIFSQEGYLLREFSSPESGAYGQWLPLEEFPLHIIRSVIAAEDRRFYYHPGFDPAAMVRSLILNLRNLRIISGGSTITQQLVRIAYPDILPSGKYMKKICEILLAFRLEVHCSKDEILEAYLNRVPMKFNQNGIPAASRRIFGRDISLLTENEGTALAVLIRENQASRDNFRKRFRALKSRVSNEVINDISDIEDIVFSKPVYSYTDDTSRTLHFDDFIRSLKYGAGGDIKTSLSGNLNSEIAEIITSEMRFLAPYGGENCSVVVLRLPSGEGEKTELAAMVGSENYHGESSGQVNGALAVRQAGSTLKPFVYGYALDHLEYFPWSIINDEPLVLGVKGSGAYSPKNNDLLFWGPITLREALACSRNIPAVFLVNRIGVDQFYRFLVSAGFSHMHREPSYYGPGLALGTGGASLLQLCRGYSAMATGGVELPVYIGRDSKGDILYGVRRSIFSEKTAYRLLHILSDMEARRRAFGSRNFMDFPFDVAAKTGTSKDFRDAWTVGFTERYVVGVWVGNFSGKVMNNISGGWGAGRIFQQVMRLVTGRERPSFRMPDNFSMVKICRATGLAAGGYCSSVMEPVDAAEILGGLCRVCVPDGRSVLHRGSNNEAEIISPAEGEIFVIDPLVPARNQQILVSIRPGVKTSGNLYYGINDQKPVRITGPVQRLIDPVRGRHIVKIYRNGGVIESSSFTVE